MKKMICKTITFISVLLVTQTFFVTLLCGFGTFFLVMLFVIIVGSTVNLMRWIKRFGISLIFIHWCRRVCFQEKTKGNCRKIQKRKGINKTSYTTVKNKIEYWRLNAVPAFLAKGQLSKNNRTTCTSKLTHKSQGDAGYRACTCDLDRWQEKGVTFLCGFGR